MIGRNKRKSKKKGPCPLKICSALFSLLYILLNCRQGTCKNLKLSRCFYNFILNDVRHFLYFSHLSSLEKRSRKLIVAFLSKF